MKTDSDDDEGRGRRRPTTPPASKYFLSRGSKVEVCSEEEGFQNAWFPATVVEPPKPATDPPPGRRTKRRKTAVVRYDHMLCDRTGAPLVEPVRVVLIRPPPPGRAAEAALEQNDVVDAFHDDIWWTGFVTRVAGDRYTVAFKNPPDVLEVGRSELRAHLDWVGSMWVKPPKEVPTGSLFSLVSEVEMDFDEDNPGTTWLPAVSLGQVGADHFILKHKSSGKDGVEHGEKLVHVKRIRPRPPPIEKKSFELLEKIEALRGSCWSVGLITRCLEGERYTVTFRHEKKEMDFNHADIRPHLDWIEGKWVTNLKGVQFTLGCQEQFSPVCNKVGSVEIIKLDESSGSLNESFCSSTWEVAEKGTYSLVQKPSDQKDSSPVDKSPYFESLNKDRVNHTSNGDNSAAVAPITDHEKNAQEDVGETENDATMYAEKRGTMLQAQFSISWPGKCKRKRNSKANSQNLQSSDTGIIGFAAKEGSSSEAAGKESLEPNDAANEEFEISGTIMEPKEVTDSHVENSCQTLIKKCENTGISCSINAKGDNPEPRALNLQTTEATGDQVSEAVVTVADRSTEKSQPPLAATHSKSTDEQAQVSLISSNGSSGVSLILRNGFSGDQAIITHVEETISLTNIGNVEPHLPFVKSSPVWQFLESTELFKNSPQNPHFRPLLNCRERGREGIAIGRMVNFSCLIGEIYNLQENDSREYIDNILETLAEYEEFGFDVKVFQDRLNQMRATKVEMEKLRDGVKGVRSEIEECADEMTKAYGKAAEIDNEMETLERKRAAVMFEIAERQSKMIKLTSEAAVMDASYSCAQKSWKSLVIAPW